MNRTHTLSRALLFTAFAGVAVVSIAACGDDSKKLTVEELSTSGATLPPGVTLPSGVDIPGLEGCEQTYSSFILAMTAAYTPNAQIDYDQVFGDLSSKIPADLQDDVVILSDAYRAFGAVLTANNNDYTNAEVQAASQALQTAEVTQALDNVTAYFDATCPEIND